MGDVGSGRAWFGGSMASEYDSGWVGAGESDDLDRSLIAEVENEPFDLATAHVMTVLGPVIPAALEVTLASGSLLGADEPPDALVDGVSLAAAELELLHAAGGRAVWISAISGDAEAMDRAWDVATRSPCHVVLAARVRGLRAEVASQATDQLVTELTAQVTIGSGRRRVRAGILGVEVSAEPDGLASAVLLDTIVETHRLTGVPMLLRGRARPVNDWLDQLMDAGIRPDRVVVALRHDEDPDADQRLLDAGATVLIEREVGRGITDRDLAMAIARRVTDGFGDQLLLGDRLGHGWNELLERLPLALMENGLDAPLVRRLFVENPARALTMVKDER